VAWTRNLQSPAVGHGAHGGLAVREPGMAAVYRTSISGVLSVVLYLKKRWRDGTAGMVFEPLDFMCRLIALIPRPRVNLLRFHGVFAPHARLRPLVVPEVEEPPVRWVSGSESDNPTRRDHRLSWAELLARVFRSDVLSCPRCSSRMSRIAWIVDHAVIRKILDSVGLATDSPSRHPPGLHETDFSEATAA
jgi:hypothetical protein